MAKGKKINWNGIEPLIGTMPDKDLAALMGCSYESVRIRRAELKIQRFEKIDWKSYQYLLGTMADSDVAEIIGSRTSTVSLHRRDLRIPQYQKSIDWNKIDRHLGKIPDTVIARHFGCTDVAVSYHRRKLGIAICSESHEWTVQSPDGLVYSFNNLTLWCKNNCSLFNCDTKNWKRITIGFAQLKRSMQGKLSRSVSQYKGWRLISWRTVEINISDELQELELPMSKTKKIDWGSVSGDLGKVTDKAIARRLDCSRQAVALKRKTLGIPVPIKKALMRGSKLVMPDPVTFEGAFLLGLIWGTVSYTDGLFSIRHQNIEIVETITRL
ncbi:MAG: hypothetical protein LBT31_10555 [Synergistaceae bacterium]|jgi:hypothetical protein|nr:hypothetical protein [Synergistaceae bacterium]